MLRPEVFPPFFVGCYGLCNCLGRRIPVRLAPVEGLDDANGCLSGGAVNWEGAPLRGSGRVQDSVQLEMRTVEVCGIVCSITLRNGLHGRFL